MVWTLRFYDNGGNEVVRVEKPDQHTYNVMRVDDDPLWDDLENHAASMRRVPFDQPPDRWINGVHFTMAPSMVELPPKEHLKAVDELSFHQSVSRTEIVDE
jgi:hypothetical protein